MEPDLALKSTQQQGQVKHFVDDAIVNKTENARVYSVPPYKTFTNSPMFSTATVRLWHISHLTLINYPILLVIDITEMRSSVVLMAFIASVSALSFNRLNVRAAATICNEIGKKCKGDETPLCCDPEGPVGFAHCVNGKVKLTHCADGCGSEAGVIQCIANPENN